jgi:hypothetical protein
MKALGLALVLLCLAGCSRQRPGPAYAAEVRAAHRTADAATSPELKRTAERALASAFERGEGPGAIAALRQDLADRAARLELELGHAQEALDWTQRGLAIEGAPSLLRANLLITEADAWVALGKRGAARQSLLAALEVNQALLTDELTEAE